MNKTHPLTLTFFFIPDLMLWFALQLNAVTMQPSQSNYASASSAKRPAAEATEYNKTTLRKIPCRARGLNDEEHNASNAYFVIKSDMRHGQVMVCSHKRCLESGRKFRYCSVCDAVVAKRMFQKRHSHGMAPPFYLGTVDTSSYSEVLEEQHYTDEYKAWKQPRVEQQLQNLHPSYPGILFAPTPALPSMPSTLSSMLPSAYNPLFTGNTLSANAQQNMSGRVVSQRLFENNNLLAMMMLQHQQSTITALQGSLLPPSSTNASALSTTIPHQSLDFLPQEQEARRVLSLAPNASDFVPKTVSGVVVVKEDALEMSSPEDDNSKPTASQQYEMQSWGEDDFDNIFNEDAEV